MRTFLRWLLPLHTSARDPSVEAARALLMLYVVGYLHLGSYVGDGQSHTGWANLPITQLMLGCFTFISGYLLAAKPLQLRLPQVLAFYRRRFARIYPLFLSALVGFVLLWLTDWRTAVKSALGLSMFWPHPPMTLWYVVMLLVCYALAPLLLAGTSRTALATGLALLGLMAAWHRVMPMDLRMATQFAAFASGVLVARTGLRRITWSPLFIGACAAALALQFLTARTPEPVSAWTAAPAVCLCSLLMLRLLDALPDTWTHHPSIRFLSHASFCAYLFHRVVYAVLERLVSFNDAAMHWLWLLAVALPTVLLLSALIQTVYDQMLLRVAPMPPAYSRP